jgi:hypothetical protein
VVEVVGAPTQGEVRRWYPFADPVRKQYL